MAPDDALCACGHVYDEHDPSGPCAGTLVAYADDPDPWPCPCVYFDADEASDGE